MQFFLAALIGGLAHVMGSLVGRVLLALGVAFYSYSGIQTVGDWLLNEVKNSLLSMPPEIMSFLAFLWVDKAVSMIFSAWSAALVIRLGGSDTLTRMVIQK